MPIAYRYAHIFFGSFTQRVGRCTNGVYAAFDRVYRLYAGPQSLVEYTAWYLNPLDVAAALAERNEDCLRETKRRLQIQLVGYSFGGQTAVNVARELNDHGVRVDRLLLCDAVARCGRLGWIWAMNPKSKIHVPKNVTRVTWLHQTHPRVRLERPYFFPAGHSVIAESPLTISKGPYEIEHEHVDMDDACAFHKCVDFDAEWLHSSHSTPITAWLPIPDAQQAA